MKTERLVVTQVFENYHLPSSLGYHILTFCPFASLTPSLLSARKTCGWLMRHMSLSRETRRRVCGRLLQFDFLRHRSFEYEDEDVFLAIFYQQKNPDYLIIFKS